MPWVSIDNGVFKCEVLNCGMIDAEILTYAVAPEDCDDGREAGKFEAWHCDHRGYELFDGDDVYTKHDSIDEAKAWAEQEIRSECEAKIAEWQAILDLLDGVADAA